MKTLAVPTLLAVAAVLSDESAAAWSVSFLEAGRIPFADTAVRNL